MGFFGKIAAVGMVGIIVLGGFAIALASNPDFLPEDLRFISDGFDKIFNPNNPVKNDTDSEPSGPNIQIMQADIIGNFEVILRNNGQDSVTVTSVDMTNLTSDYYFNTKLPVTMASGEGAQFKATKSGERPTPLVFEVIFHFSSGEIFTLHRSDFYIPNPVLGKAQQSPQYVEEFEDYQSGRYTNTTNDGVYSSWDGTVDDGLLSFEKSENSTLADLLSQDFTVSGSGRDPFVNCNNHTGASNYDCSANFTTTTLYTAGSGWLSGYSYRREITLDASRLTAPESNYVVSFYLSYANGTDTNYTIYLDGEVRPDFLDIRWTSVDGETLLDYDVTDVVTSTSATTLVEIPTLTNGSNTAFIYYGYSSAGDGTDSGVTIALDSYLDYQSNWANGTTYDCDNQTVLNEGWTASDWDRIDCNTVYVVSAPTSVTLAADGVASSATLTRPINNTDSFLFEHYIKWHRFAQGTFSTVDINYYFKLGTTDYLRIKIQDVFTTQTNVPWLHIYTKQNGGSEVLRDQNTTALAGIYYGGSSLSTNYNRTVYAKIFLNSSGLFYYTSGGGAWTLRYTNTDINDYISVQFTSLQIGVHADSWVYQAQVGKIYFDDSNMTIDYYRPLTNVGTEDARLGSDSNFYIGYLAEDNLIYNSEGVGSVYQTGINRFFPSVDLSRLETLEQTYGLTPDSVRSLTLDFGTATTNLTSTQSLQVFVYEMTVSDNIPTYTTMSGWSDASMAEFWSTNTTKIISQVFSSSAIPSDGLLDITTLGNEWLSTRTTNFTRLGFGMQIITQPFETSVAVTASSVSSFVVFQRTLALEIDFELEFIDYANQSLALELEQANNFITSIDLQFVQNDTSLWSTNANQFYFQLAVESNVGNTATATHYFRTVVWGDGSVYLEWRDVGGTGQSYSTGATLVAGKQYKLTFEVDRSASSLKFSILNSTSDSVLDPVAWQNYVASDVDERPSFFSTAFLDENWRTDTTPAHRRGVLLTLKVLSSDVYTGDTSWALDRLLSTAGLLTEEFYCNVAGGTNSCQSTTGTAQLFDEAEPFGTVWDTNDNGTATVEYVQTVRDFRAFSGLASINGLDDLNGSVGYFFLALRAYPIFVNGTVSDNPVEFVIQLTQILDVSLNHLYHDLNVQINDNTTVDLYLGEHTADGAGAPPGFDAGFGLYWTEKPGVLAMSMKVYDQDLAVVQTHTIFGNFPAEDTTRDLYLKIEYEIDGGYEAVDTDSDQKGSMTITDSSLISGATLPFGAPGIPRPQFDWMPPPKPGLFDGVLNGLGGVAGALLSGDLFGALGGAFGGLFRLVDDIFGLFGLVGGWIADIVSDLFDGALNWFITDFIGGLFGIWDALVIFIFVTVFSWQGGKDFLDGLVTMDWIGFFGDILNLAEFIIGLGVWVFLVMFAAMWLLPIMAAQDERGRVNPARAMNNVGNVWFKSVSSPDIWGFRLGVYFVVILFVFYMVLAASGSLINIFGVFPF